MVKINDDRHVLWIALVVAVAILLIGLSLGFLFEQSRVDTITNLYSTAETNLYDLQLQTQITNFSKYSCNQLVNQDVNFADRIYSEAITLENYESANKINNQIVELHRKYDLMRTLLWVDSSRTLDKCKGDVSLIVYLYDYNPSNQGQSARQKVWSQILSDAKDNEGNNTILIPIAVNNNLISLDSVLSQYNITSYPAVIINNKDIIYEINSTAEVESYLNSTSQ